MYKFNSVNLRAFEIAMLKSKFTSFLMMFETNDVFSILGFVTFE